jgi:serine protease Do
MNEIHMRRWAAGIFLLLALIVGGVVGSMATAKTNRGVPLFVTKDPTGGGSETLSFENGFEPVISRVLPAVVNISSTKTIKVQGGNPYEPFFNDPFFRQFFGNERQFRVPKERREHSLGSGVIVSPEGHILTNNHVVEGATQIRVSLPDHREFTGRLVGTDAKTDLAVVKIEQRGLPVIALADSSKVKPGHFVLAVGDPFGVGETVTMGIVSATGRGGLGIEDYEDFIQTDAAINPGNSGGALVNVHGHLIGINTAILSGSGGNQGVGFAVPINMASNVMQHIIKSGKVTRGWLGVGIQPVTPEIAQAFGLKETRGALVGNVEPDTPAARAGLKQGDVIIAINGQQVEDARTLSLKIAELAPGTNVRLTIVRSGQQQEVNVTLGEMPNKSARAESPSERGNSSPLSGLSVENLTADIAQQLNLPRGTAGVVVDDVAPGSPAAEAGLDRGDVIQEVNRKPVRSVSEFNGALRQGGNKPVLLLVNRGGNSRYVVVQPQ